MRFLDPDDDLITTWCSIAASATVLQSNWRNTRKPRHAAIYFLLHFQPIFSSLEDSIIVVLKGLYFTVKISVLHFHQPACRGSSFLPSNHGRDSKDSQPTVSPLRLYNKKDILQYLKVSFLVAISKCVLPKSLFKGVLKNSHRMLITLRGQGDNPRISSFIPALIKCDSHYSRLVIHIARSWRGERLNSQRRLVSFSQKSEKADLTTVTTWRLNILVEKSE